MELPEFDKKFTKTVGEYGAELKNGEVELFEDLEFHYIRMVSLSIRISVSPSIFQYG
jgi:hypothetical protein